MNTNSILNQRHVKAALESLGIHFDGNIYNDKRVGHNRIKLFGAKLAHDNPELADELKQSLQDRFPNHTIDIKPWTSDGRSLRGVDIKSTVINYIADTIDWKTEESDVIEWSPV